jgi:hypothetical protein
MPTRTGRGARRFRCEGRILLSQEGDSSLLVHDRPAASKQPSSKGVPVRKPDGGRCARAEQESRMTRVTREAAELLDGLLIEIRGRHGRKDEGSC